MSSGALETYLQEAVSWDTDRFLEARRSARRAWQAAAVGWGCALAAALALLLLVPLKSVEPFVVRVDRSTGVVDVVPMYAGGAPLEQARDTLFPHALRECVRALQFRDRRERLRGMRRVPRRAA